MAIEKVKMSQAQYDKIKADLDDMETVRTREVAEQLKEARGFGDLSENSEYDEAKSEQGKLYSKIAELHNLLENAEIVEAEIVAQGVVGLGCKVTVLDLEFDEEVVFQIVGSQEADPANGRISDESPFGKALLGSKVGDIVTAEAPAGQFQYEVLEITR